jgi:hypothetical protein
MKKFFFLFSFVLLTQVTLAEDTKDNTHANTNPPATTNSTQATQKPVAPDRSGKLFELISACLAGRTEAPNAASVLPVTK